MTMRLAMFLAALALAGCAPPVCDYAWPTVPCLEEGTR